MTDTTRNDIPFIKMPGMPVSEAGPLRTTLRVIYALIMRQVRAQFGNSHIGYLGVLGGPVFYIVALSLLFQIMGRGVPIAVPGPLFFLCSLMPFISYIRTYSSLGTSVEAGKGLLSFPILRPLDFFVAKTVLEIIAKIFTFVILATVIYAIWCEPRHLPERPLGVLLVLIITVVHAAALGLIFAILVVHVPWLAVCRILLARALLLTSGKFFLADQLPSFIQEIFWWFPLLHCTEWMRSAFFSEYESKFLSIEYVFGSLIVMLCVGLLMEQHLLRVRKFT